jgi:hypothetical protein
MDAARDAFGVAADAAADAGTAVTEMASNAAAYLTDLLTGGHAPKTAGTEEITSSLPQNFYSKKFSTTSSLSQLNPVNPTEIELAQIYQPRRVQQEVGTRQYLRHIPTGFSVPIPSQQLMRQAVEMGVGDMTTKIHVTRAQEKIVIHKVDPPPQIVLSPSAASRASDRVLQPGNQQQAKSSQQAMSKPTGLQSTRSQPYNN